MAKVLVIRKPNARIEKVPLFNKAALMAYNNKLKKDQQWTFEVMDEEKAAELPHIDPNYITGAKAVQKVGALEKAVTEKDQQIAALQKQLALLSKGSAGSGAGSAGTGITKRVYATTVPALVASIKKAKTADEVTLLVGDDDRKGVLDAAAKQTASFNK